MCKGIIWLRRCLSQFQLSFLTLIVFLFPLTTTDSCADPVGRGNRPQQVVTMKNASGGRELVFGTTTDLGILRVFHENDESAGALIRLNKPQTIFVRNGFAATLVIGSSIKENPQLLKLFPTSLISGIDLNGIASPTRTNAKELLIAASNFKNLKKLYVGGTEITDKDIALLAQFKYLDTLCVSYTRLTGNALATLPSIPHWTLIDANRIHGIKILIRKLPQAHQIKDVRVINKDLTNEDLEIISRLPKVENLEISTAPMNVQSIKYLARMKKLTHLAVRYCHFEGNSIEELAKLKGLKELYVSRDMVYSYPFLASSHGKTRTWKLGF